MFNLALSGYSSLLRRVGRNQERNLKADLLAIPDGTTSNQGTDSQGSAPGTIEKFWITHELMLSYFLIQLMITVILYCPPTCNPRTQEVETRSPEQAGSLDYSSQQTLDSSEGPCFNI